MTQHHCMSLWHKPCKWHFLWTRQEAGAMLLLRHYTGYSHTRTRQSIDIGAGHTGGMSCAAEGHDGDGRTHWRGIWGLCSISRGWYCQPEWMPMWTVTNDTKSNTMPSLPVVVVGGQATTAWLQKWCVFSPSRRADFGGEISGDSGTKPSILPESPLLVYNMNVCNHTFLQWK